MRPRRLLIYFLVIMVLMPVICRGDESSELIKGIVSLYFEELFNLQKSDIQLEFLHLPKTVLPTGRDYKYLVESNRNLPRLGHQIVWLKVTDKKSLVSRLPITVDVSVNMNVVLAAKKLRRGELIDSKKILLKTRKISRDYKNIVKTPNMAIGMITKQVIREGEIIKKSMLREPPDIQRGDRVKIQLLSKDLVIITNGEVKEDGVVGNKVKVVCAMTGKLMYGIVQSSQLVTVQLQ